MLLATELRKQLYLPLSEAEKTKEFSGASRTPVFCLGLLDQTNSASVIQQENWIKSLLRKERTAEEPVESLRS